MRAPLFLRSPDGEGDDWNAERHVIAAAVEARRYDAHDATGLSRTPGMIEIRDVLPAEFAAAGAATVAGYRDFYRERLGSYAEDLADIAGRADGARVLVAVEGGAILGTVTYVGDVRSAFAQYLRSGEAGIRMLSVSPQHQQRGAGRALSVACIELARSEGKRAVSLHADELMAVSQRLYESLGFVRDPGRDFQPDGWTKLLAFVLEL